MTSSNRHWPSMFRSKPCIPQHQFLPSGCYQTPLPSSGCAERTPEPKPRWNPKPEQIRILEAIFDSGMVNPPRDEIRKIRAQLQEYGQVGDANVFYWFQNRKSRSKHKLRHLQNSKQQKQINNSNSNSSRSGYTSMTSPPSVIVPPRSTPPSSSPSEKSSPIIVAQLSSETTALSLGSIINPTDYFPSTASATGVREDQYLTEIPMPFLPQKGVCFSAALPSAPSVSEHTGVAVGPFSNLLLSELLGQEKLQGGEGTKMKSMLGYPSLIGDVGSHPAAASVALATSSASKSATTVAALSLPGVNNHSYGVPEAVEPGALGEGSKSTVFINDVAFQVSSGPFNVRETFGDAVVLINSAGELIITDQWGVSIQSLQHDMKRYGGPSSSICWSHKAL